MKGNVTIQMIEFLLIGSIDLKQLNKKMELFKTDLLKREFERFQNKVLTNLLECGLCQCNSCKSDRKFIVTCDRCRKARFQACNSFNIAKENLFKNFYKEGKDYLENFIQDFLNLFNENLRESFAVIVTLPRPQNYNVKSYRKSEKCSSQVVYKNLDECKKIEYTVIGRKRSYYNKFWFYI